MRRAAPGGGQAAAPLVRAPPGRTLRTAAPVPEGRDNGPVRFFNTAGPVVRSKHYCLPPLSRLDLEEVLELVRSWKYFVLHAPRQSGKTSALMALRELLNSGQVGEFRAVQVNFEVGQAAREDTARAMRAILAELAERALEAGDNFLDGVWEDYLAKAGPDGALNLALSRWSRAAGRPLVLLVDEIDALVGDTLISVVRQLRAGYDKRPRSFPQSVLLCGLRDVEDYRAEWEEKAGLAAGSPFNILSDSLRLGDFSEAEVAALLGQHTAETGQEFLPAAVELVRDQTRGQPWLVNALAYEACFRGQAGRARGHAITAEDILQAREALILRRDTHIQQLGRRLREERVRRVVEPMLTGAPPAGSAQDLAYARDLGLIRPDPPARIANPIYREVVPRELTAVVQQELTLETTPYLAADGGLLASRLLADFQQWFRGNSEHWLELPEYREAARQLLLMAFCQKIVNSGGRVEREYAAGRGRMDLLLVWPHGRREQRVVVECKVLRGGIARTIRAGVEQTTAYMDTCGAQEGHLVIFDRDPDRPWKQKIFRREERGAGPRITVWGM